MSVIGAVVAAFLFFLPLILSTDASVGIYAGATFLLSVKIGWFVFSYKLHQKNNAEDVTGVKKIIKIGSYIIGSVQVGIFALLLVSGIILIAIGTEIPSAIGSKYYVLFGGIMTPIGGLFLIFPSLLLHGIRTKHSGKVQAWIIFKCVILGLILPVCIVNSFLTGEVLLIILSALFYTLTILYSSAMVIVHYNILLDDENVLGSALNKKKQCR